jgi:hypothetical protein
LLPTGNALRFLYVSKSDQPKPRSCRELSFCGPSNRSDLIGIYGLIQYSVTTRFHEIGIRMAVGAQPGHVFRMFLSVGLKLSLIGLGSTSPYQPC